ncbi:unnamed protein product, partial [marine sediment metagenome]
MASTSDRYLESAVRTAPPQKLHLMMIEAAIRFCQTANGYLEAEQHE